MKNIVITILSVLVVGLSCFIVYDKVINKEENSGDNVEKSSTRILNFSNRLSLDAFSQILEKGYNEIKDVKIDDLSDKDLIFLAPPQGSAVELTEDESENYAYHFQIKESDYINSIKEVFGKRAQSIDFEKTIGDGFKVGIEEYRYNKDAKTIERYILSGGFNIYNRSTEKIDVENNALYLYENVTIVTISEEFHYKLKFTYMLNDNHYNFYRLQVIE